MRNDDKAKILFNLLERLRLTAVAGAVEKVISDVSLSSMDILDQLIIIFQAEVDARDEGRFKRLLKKSRLSDAMPDVSRITYEPERKLRESTVRTLCRGDWVDSPEHGWLAITGATGTGKTWLAKAILRSLLKNGISGVYYDTQEFMDLLAEARENKTITKFRKEISKFRVIVLDDFQLFSADNAGLIDFLGILKDRCESGGLILVTQSPVSELYGVLGNDGPLVDSIMDRMVNNCFSVDLKGRSLRERRKSK